MLRVSVAAGKSGPVITLAGEANLACAAELSALISGQVGWGTRTLTIDASGLTFADSMSMRPLLRAARTLHGRGGGLVLLRPQPPVARMLAMIGAEQMVTIRGIS